MRFVEEPEDATAQRTQASFGYEWTEFNDWRPSGDTNFAQYFGDLDLSSLRDMDVLDAGCGMGRHARQIAEYARRVLAFDFSVAIEQAARNTGHLGNVRCVQADLLAPPIRDGAFDFVYSLGVLHHLTDPERAIRTLAAKVKPGGRLRIYLYWKRRGVSGVILRFVDVVRRFTTRLPFGVLKRLCLIGSLALNAAVITPYRIFSAIGLRRHETWPLFVYTRYPFRVLYNDQFDRFSAPLETRYDPEEVARMLKRAGLENVRVWPAFGWLAEGTRARLVPATEIPIVDAINRQVPSPCAE